ncbi:MAG: hypothetical protein ACT4UQ_05435 [Gammaproteobacteria bacterium]
MTALNRFLLSWRNLSVAALLACTPPAGEAMEASAAALAEGVSQLRQAIGLWNVRTRQFNEDGSVAQTVEGTYQFDWVVPDRVISGRSAIPVLGQASGILFYVNERRATLEMVSVGADGQLWVMTGPVDGETRTTPVTPLADGRMMQLRFTRFNVESNCFESKMEVSFDGGASWKPGNHQQFVRATGESGGTVGLRYRKRLQNYVPLT